MLSAKEFTNKLYDDSAAMFEASKMQVKAYFESDLSKEELVDHFIGRMTNERMNMVEISKKISELPKNTSVQEYQLLCKQALDEAIHYRLVKEVVEHLTGNEVELESAIDSWESRIKSKGASLIEKFNGHNDPIALALYQMIAEGRTNSDIADLLAYSDSLIRQETIKIYSILGCSGRLEAARIYKAHGKELATASNGGKRGA